MLRARHGSDPLSQDADLNLGAESYARNLAQKRNPTPTHDPNLPKGVGENIYIQCGAAVLGATVTDIW